MASPRSFGYPKGGGKKDERNFWNETLKKILFEGRDKQCNLSVMKTIQKKVIDYKDYKDYNSQTKPTEVKKLNS